MKDLTTSKNPLSSKSFNLSVQIVNICKILRARKTDSAIINQLIKSGTSIGANVMEANNSESPKDFIHKLAIAQKEAAETHYWLKLLLETKYISIQEYESMNGLAIEALKMIKSIIKTTKLKYSGK